MNPGQFRSRDDSIGELSQTENDMVDQFTKISPLRINTVNMPNNNEPSTPNTTVFHGKVGINTAAPEEALSVVGNVKLTGVVLQPSDIRVKENIEPV